MELARRLRAARGYLGIDRPQMAQRLGVSTSTLGRWERGELTPDDLKRHSVIERIAEASGLPAEFFTADFRHLADGDGDGPAAEQLLSLYLSDRDVLLRAAQVLLPGEATATKLDRRRQKP